MPFKVWPAQHLTYLTSKTIEQHEILILHLLLHCFFDHGHCPTDFLAGGGTYLLLHWLQDFGWHGLEVQRMGRSVRLL
jgi:hypothetical protein